MIARRQQSEGRCTGQRNRPPLGGGDAEEDGPLNLELRTRSRPVRPPRRYLTLARAEAHLKRQPVFI